MKPKALLVDLDGTLAHGTGRGWYDYTQIYTDEVDETVRDLCIRYSVDHRIIIVTARDESSRKETVQWLSDNNIPADAMYMKQDGDEREDCDIKAEIYLNRIKDHFDVSFALEDRQQCVDKYRQLGVTCFEVKEGSH